ncbi:U-box domain-containing protein 52 isoform X1 [Elaeis guineensis]|uniref:U-box domain-containing protein 52 isoform X1 n=1 Tax=Elaeis guineensis var. tenera TaxID=51953 RepID=UPI003C6D855A
MHLGTHSLSSPPTGEGSGPAAVTAVAVDKDKNSLHAVKWAVDHVTGDTKIVTLIHVKIRSHPHNQGTAGVETSTEATREQADEEIAQLFRPYIGFFARKGLQLNEVILEDVDVSKAIIEYISANHIQNIVVGASNRNALMRRFRNPDVPSNLTKAVPEFCAVHVICKGKPITVRAAKGSSPANAAPPRQPPARHRLSHQATDAEDSVRNPFGRASLRGLGTHPASLERTSFEGQYDYMKTTSRDRPLAGARSASNASFDSLDSSVRAPRFFHGDTDLQDNMGLQSMEFSDSLEFSSSASFANHPAIAGQDVEAEMKRLRLELKRTMEMYNTACKEAIMAKQKARELQQWKMDETRMFEELKHAEETALAIAEMEKAKCQAAIEAAEAAQKIAEHEAQKRLNAELKAKREAEEKKKALEALVQNDVRYRKYTIEDIEVATNEFSAALKIGEGGYGPVYKASLDHTPVAIKVLRPDAAHGRRQFLQEVEVLSCIRHPNMVLLLGACPEYGILVYEYMDYGSLEDRLFRRGNTPPIPWTVRFKIAAEIATGLLFLHQAKPEPLVHRDLKPANILLNRNYVSKISDVGLARLVPPSVANNVTQYRMTSTAGTFCYIDPEYQQTGMLGVKSDIYSLGIMLLQIITAKPPMGLTHHVERAIEKGAFEQMLDPAVTDWPVEEALSFAKLALKCAELRRKDRPDLGTVILPELDRFRKFGHAYKENAGGNIFGPSPHSSNISQPRIRSHTTQDQVSSNSISSAPWLSSADI